MKQTLVDLFTSKKFLAALTAVVVYVAGRFGFDVDAAVLDRVFQALLVYVGAQGIADAGKSAALVRAAAPSSAAGTKAPIGVAVLALVVLGLGAASSLTACAAGSTARQDAAAGIVAALNCEASSIDPAALADARGFAEAKVQAWISGASPADLAGLKAKILADLRPVKSNLGRCAVAGALAVITAIAAPAPGVATSALVAGPDPALVRAAFGGAARELGWPPVRVSGTVL